MASFVGKTLLTAGLALVSPTATLLAQNEVTPVVQPSPEAALPEGMISVPVFTENSREIDTSNLRSIESVTNLRAEPSIDAEIRQQLQAKSIVRQDDIPLSVAGQNWYTTTLIYNGDNGQVITDTNKLENNGYLREDVRGNSVEGKTLPGEVISLLEKENIPPISLTGEFNYTKTLESLQGIGGTAELSNLIASLFNQPATFSDSDGKAMTFFEYAASGSDITATLDLITGISIFQKSLGENLAIFPSLNGLTAVQVGTDSEGNIENWDAASLRLPVENGDDLFLVQKGNLIQQEGHKDYFDQQNTLLTYQQLIKLYGKEFADKAAVNAPIMSGLVNTNNEVNVLSENKDLTTVIEMVDAVYTPEFGVVDLPGNQEILGYLGDGQEIGTTKYQDGKLIVHNTQGETILQLKPAQDKDSILWLPIIEAEKKLELGDPMDYKISINGIDYIPGEVSAKGYQVDGQGNPDYFSYMVATVIASKPYTQEIKIDDQRSVILYLVDTAVPGTDYKKGNKDADWTKLAPVIVWHDMKKGKVMQGIRNICYYGEGTSIDGSAEYTPGAYMDSTLLPIKINTRDVEGAVERPEYASLRKQCLDEYVPGRGLVMITYPYLNMSNVTSYDPDNLDDPKNATTFIALELNSSFVNKNDENKLNVTVMGDQYLTGEPGKLIFGPKGENERIDPSKPDLSQIKNPVIGKTYLNFFYDLPEKN